MANNLKLAYTGQTTNQAKIIEADDKLILQCGKSTIELHTNGKIYLTGLQIIQTGKQNIKLHSKKIELN